jgi:hypothetical protein
MKYFLLAALAVSTALAQDPVWKEQSLPAIKASLQLPEGWSIKEETEDGVVVYQITREKLESSSDTFTEELILSTTPKVSERAGMKPSEYAAELLAPALEEGGKELQKSEEGALKSFRTEYMIESEQGKMLVINIAKANDTTGTLYFLTWQSLASEPAALSESREKILSSLKLDPAF